MVNEDNKISKEAKHALDLGLKVLEHAMEVAAENQELEAMIAISDRLMMLYQYLSDKGTKKFKMGFGIIDSVNKKNSKAEEDDTDGESD